MRGGAYYNEFDPYAAQWLRNLIAAGHLPAGDVDDRSILDVSPDDLRGYSDCHFFAGIGGWPLALRIAGWEGAVWTGSCPCQPLSSAGQRKGHADERHLWPAFHRLIAERRPAVVLGEQVASKDGREWLAGVRADLEALGYACGAADLCAAGVGAPHIRQRLFWVADTAAERHANRGQQPSDSQDEPGSRPSPVRRRSLGGLGDADNAGPQGWRLDAGERPDQQPAGPAGIAGRMGDAASDGRREDVGHVASQAGGRQSSRYSDGPSERFWSAADWLPCTDGKARRVEPGTFPLAHGVLSRVGRLRAYGNAIVPQVAAQFVSAFVEARAA